MTAPGSRHRVRRITTESGYAARCSCGWATVRRSRELRDVDVAAHETTHAAERVTPVSAYVCRLHPDQHTTWKGTGCPECAPMSRSSGRRGRLQRRQAIEEAFEQVTGWEQ